MLSKLLYFTVLFTAITLSVNGMVSGICYEITLELNFIFTSELNLI